MIIGILFGALVFAAGFFTGRLKEVKDQLYIVDGTETRKAVVWKDTETVQTGSLKGRRVEFLNDNRVAQILSAKPGASLDDVIQY